MVTKYARNVNRDGVLWRTDENGKLLGFTDNRGNDYDLPRLSDDGKSLLGPDNNPVSVGGGATVPDASILSAIAGLPALAHYYPMSDVLDANYTQFDSKVYASGSLQNFQQGHGIMAGAPPLVQGLPSATSTLFSYRSSPIASGLAGYADNVGTTVAAHVCIVMPMVTRSGAPRFYQAITKRNAGNNTTANAGYALGLYWTGTKTVIAFRLQGATAANFMFAIGSTDIPNFTPVMIGVQMTGAKTAASHEFYINGQPETQGTPVSDTMGADSATNTGNYCVGGINGTQTVDTREGFAGAIYGVAPYHGFRLTPSMHAALYTMASVGKVQPRTAGAVAKNLLANMDFNSDIDDLTTLLLLIAAHLRGEINLLGVVLTASNLKSSALVEAVLNQAGLSSIPVAAYKGNDRASTDPYETTVCTAFGITKTAANYLDPQTLLKSVLTNNSAVTILELGPQQELAALMNSAGGQALISAKVAQTVIMGGYSSGATAEYNLVQAKANAADVAANWPLPITYVPFEVATGTSVAVPGNGLIQVARRCFEEWWLNLGNLEPNFYRGSSFDVVAALYAVRGLVGGALTLSHTNATQTVNTSTGANTWGADGSGRHNCVTVASSTPLIVQMEGLIAEAVFASSKSITGT